MTSPQWSLKATTDRYNNLSFLVISFLTLLHLPIRHTQAQTNQITTGTLYDLVPNVRLTDNSGRSRALPNCPVVSRCLFECLADTQCLSISFDTVEGVCYVHHVSLTSSDIHVQYDTNFVYTEILERLTWTLAFRGTKGIGGTTLLEVWNNDGYRDNEMTVTNQNYGCFTVDGRLPCDRHFRSWRLDDWSGISEVKYSFLDDGQSVFFVKANATDTTHRDQSFAIPRIIDSTATELIAYTGPYNYDSVQGLELCKRSFYLSKSWFGCSSDWAWMIVSDDRSAWNSCCNYDMRGPHPKFMYTKQTSAVNWLQSGEAQVFAVFVKYK